MNGREGSALLRTAGLPIRLWLAAGSPELFALLRRRDRAEAEYTALGREPAERIGTGLVHHPALSTQERRAALSVRRRLYGGHAVSPRDAKRLGALAALSDPVG